MTDLMNVMFVTKDLHIQVTWQHIKKHTQERNLMNVMFVTKDLHVQETWLDMKEHTQERNLVQQKIYTNKCLSKA